LIVVLLPRLHRLHPPFSLQRCEQVIPFKIYEENGQTSRCRYRKTRAFEVPAASTTVLAAAVRGPTTYRRMRIRSSVLKSSFNPVSLMLFLIRRQNVSDPGTSSGRPRGFSRHPGVWWRRSPSEQKKHQHDRNRLRSHARTYRSPCTRSPSAMLDLTGN